MAQIRALLVGIDAYPDAPLRGARNDTLRMRRLLEQRHGLTAEGVRVLHDSQATRQAILEGLAWLLERSTSGAPMTKLFQFSGHGTFIADEDGDEPDGADECLVPYDHGSAGLIVDDELGRIFDARPREDPLVLVVDSCHSGTIQKIDDRPGVVARFLKPSARELRRVRQAAERYMQRVDREIELLEASGLSEQEARRAGVSREDEAFGVRSTDDGVVLLAGCASDEPAADAPFEDGCYGAFTKHLLDVLERGPQTYGDLIAAAATALRGAGFSQTPQLECGEELRSAWFLGAAPAARING